jgi:hypothetical protein
MAKKDKTPLTPEQEAAKAEKAARAKAAKEAREAAKAAEAAAATAVPCVTEDCEKPATLTYGEGEDKVDVCEDCQEAVSNEYDPPLTAEDWTPIVPIDAPKAPSQPASKAPKTAAPAVVAAARPYDAKRRQQLVQAIRNGGCVKLRGGKIVNRIEDLP